MHDFLLNCLEKKAQKIHLKHFLKRNFLHTPWHECSLLGVLGLPVQDREGGRRSRLPRGHGPRTRGRQRPAPGCRSTVASFSIQRRTTEVETYLWKKRKKRHFEKSTNDIIFG